MGFRRKNSRSVGRRRSRRYSDRSTRRRLTLRLPAHPGRILAVVLGVVGVVTLALVWGNHLKAKSDAYREAESRNAWTVAEDIARPLPGEVPGMRGMEIRPEGNVGDILIAGSHECVLLPLGNSSQLSYASAVGVTAGVAGATGTPDFVADVSRVAGRGLYVTGVFTVTSYGLQDTAERTYRRGLELALLAEYAAAEPDALLLAGLPAGTDAADRWSVDFLQELATLLADLPTRPAIGVALSPQAFYWDGTVEDDDLAYEGKQDDTPAMYAGNISPARIRNACEFLCLDLRAETAAELEALLPRLQYPYVRHELHLLVNRDDTAAVDAALEHGFRRVWEMKAEDDRS